MEISAHWKLGTRNAGHKFINGTNGNKTWAQIWHCFACHLGTTDKNMLWKKALKGPCSSGTDADRKRQSCIMLQHSQCMKYTLLRGVSPAETAKHSWYCRELSGCHLDAKYKCHQPRSREEFSWKRDTAGVPGPRGEGKATSQGQPTETCFSLASKNQKGELLLSKRSCGWGAETPAMETHYLNRKTVQALSASHE